MRFIPRWSLLLLLAGLGLFVGNSSPEGTAEPAGTVSNSADAMKGAELLYRNGLYQQAADLLGKIRAKDPYYPGLSKLERRVKSKLKKAERQKERSLKSKSSDGAGEGRGGTPAVVGGGPSSGNTPRSRKADAAPLSKKKKREDKKHGGLFGLFRGKRQRTVPSRSKQEQARLDRTIKGFYDSGRTFYAKGDILTAQERLRWVLSLDPRHRGAIKYLSKIAKKLEEELRDKSIRASQARRKELEQSPEMQALKGVQRALKDANDKTHPKKDKKPEDADSD